MPVTTCVFDAYGTLFDVAAAARTAAAEPGHAALAGIWPTLSATWRDKQLQYTWLRAIRGDHTDFWRVTEDALDWAMEEAGLDDAALRTRLLALYRELGAYPEVPEVLARLKSGGRQVAILSNGSMEMLEAAVGSAGIGASLDAILSVDAVGVFKPDDRVYALVEQRLGAAPQEVLFVSSNGWDIAGASAFGFRTAWANRAGAPVDRLPGQPDRIIPDLRPVPELAEALA